MYNIKTTYYDDQRLQEHQKHNFINMCANADGLNDVVVAI